MSGQPNMVLMKSEIEWQQIHRWINQLKKPEKRENALRELVRKRFDTADLAIILWKSTGTTLIFLQEIINLFATINPADITNQKSERICFTLQLLRTVASHPETRLKFVRGNLPLYLYPFLNTTWTSEAFERAREISLGILTSLVGSCESEVLTFLLQTDLIPLLLRLIAAGSGICRNNAIITLHKILISNDGLAYILRKQELVDDINLVLNKMILRINRSLVTVYMKRCLKRLTDKNF